MAARDELLQHLWSDVIGPHGDPDGLRRMIAHARADPSAPLSGAGRAAERLLSAGCDPRDVCLLLRATAYEAVFGTLYAIGDPGVDGNDVFGLHEELLGADPSGTEGRWGSAAEP